MRYRFTAIFFCCFFFSYTSFAFQSPQPPYIFSIPELNQLRLDAEIHVSNSLPHQALKAFQALQEKCWEYHLDSVAIDIYEDIFTACILSDNQTLDKTLAFIDSCYQQETDSSINGIYYGAIAHAYLFYGEIDSMEKYYDLAISIYDKQKRYLQAANLNINIAIEYFFLEHLAIAKVYLNKAEFFEKNYLIPQQLYTPALYPAQTAIYRELGLYETAIKSAIKTIRHSKNNKSMTPYTLAYDYVNLAAIYKGFKDNNNALNYYHKALSILKSITIDDPNEITHVLYNIASIFQEQGKIAKAKQYALQSISLIEKADTLNKNLQENLIHNYQLLVDCYSDQDSVLYYIHKALEVHYDNSYRINITYRDYGYYFFRKHDFKNAQLYGQKSLEAALKIYGTKHLQISLSYLLLARTTFAKRHYTQGFQYLQEALSTLSTEFSDKDGLSNPRLDHVIDKTTLLAILYEKMKYLNILYNQDYPIATEKILYQTAKLATQTIESINRSIKSRASQLAWLNEEAIPAFEQAIQIALSIYKKTNNTEYLSEAFALAERSKSMLMISTFQENEAFALGKVPQELIHRERALYQLLSDSKKKHFDATLSKDEAMMAFQDSLIFEYTDQIMMLLHQFELEYPEYYKLKYTIKSTGIKAVQDQLDAKTAFIEYFEGVSNIYAFSITKQTATVHTIPRTDSYHQDVADFQAILIGLDEAAQNTAKSYNQFLETAHQFYLTFLKNSLQNTSVERLIIIPDGRLSYLPFEAFLTKEVPLDINQSNSNANFAPLPYLIRDYKINYNYSATLWIEHLLQKETSKNGRILALAPSYANKTAPKWRSPYEKQLRTELVELPGAIRELDFLKWSFDGTFLVNGAATEAAFKEKALDYSILHFAVHGLVDTKHPEFSGLALAENGDKMEDNILYTYEIKQLGLNADLVVLSACETGIGKYQLGEGILSIGRDFMYAGVPSMLTTLWSLNDYSSSIIIEKFYTNLSLGMEKDEAIQQAKLYYLDNYEGLSTHPALWACFVQVGDYASIPIHKSYRTWYIALAVFGGLLLLSSFVFFKFRAR
ncbi:CHAT domain-containing tetratricopeptide repeat protein [Aureispira sp. CCB-QB1]|uniref:CHAT domain-containing protein n=1 Tax=Aureispira sp. CCB-QB1 TaxID=1313421 RepID=UPI000695B599|nr:CHAT domain-containing tetratricopeptide repeat protein [Aureispira sp. CCB-QB1]